MWGKLGKGEVDALGERWAPPLSSELYSGGQPALRACRMVSRSMLSAGSARVSAPPASRSSAAAESR